jgi:halocin C8-like bacteriocin domain-containing protein
MEESDSDPDFDEEQYQNELNDAVDDGGGCMETLQAANQVSNSNETNFGDFNTDENRRSVLQKTVASLAGVAGFGGLSGMAAGSKGSTEPKSRASDDPDFEATDVEVRAGDEVPRATAMALNNSEINKLKAAMRSEGKMQPSGMVSVDVETTDPDLNDVDPRVVIVPFEPVGNRPVDPRDTTGQTDPANVGALFAVTVVQEGERQAATAFGVASHPTQSGAKTIERVDNSASDAGQFQAKLMTFGQDQAGEEPAMVGSQTTKLPIRNARRPNQDQNSSSSLNSVGTGSGTLSTAQVSEGSILSCFQCTTLVGILCKLGGGRLSQSTCLVRCLPLITTIGGYLICSGGCLLVVEAISRVGCGLGSGYVCIVAGYCN